MTIARVTVRRWVNGKPEETIRHTRFRVRDILEMRQRGMTYAEILDEHPELELGDLLTVCERL